VAFDKDAVRFVTPLLRLKNELLLIGSGHAFPVICGDPMV
jgi:hypothetical protein